MRRSTLILALSFCVLVLTTPMLMWLAGRWLSFVDERWMDALGSLSFTVPIGLALAAIVLAIHGVLLNRFLAEEAFDLLAADAAAADAAMAGAAVPGRAPTGGVSVGAGGTAVATAPPPAPGSQMPPPADQTAEPSAPKDKKKQGKAAKSASKMGKRTVRKVKSRGKSAVRRQVRSQLPRF